MDPPFPFSKGVEVVVEFTPKFGTRKWLKPGDVFEGRGLRKRSTPSNENAGGKQLLAFRKVSSSTLRPQLRFEDQKQAVSRGITAFPFHRFHRITSFRARFVHSFVHDFHLGHFEKSTRLRSCQGSKIPCRLSIRRSSSSLSMTTSPLRLQEEKSLAMAIRLSLSTMKTLALRSGETTQSL